MKSCSSLDECHTSRRRHRLYPNYLKKYTRLGLFVIKPTRCTNFTNLFCHETLHVSDSSSVHHQDFNHCNSAMVYVTQVCRQLSSRACRSCSKAVYKHVWHIPLLSVQWLKSWWWTDELSETGRVSWQNKFVKLVHLFSYNTKRFVTMHGHMNVNPILCVSNNFMLSYFNNR